jgi:hypothetical protein
MEGKLLCLDFKQGYSFSDSTMVSLKRFMTPMPMRNNSQDKKLTIEIGSECKKILLQNFLEFIVEADSRVNLRIEDVNLEDLNENKETQLKHDSKNLSKCILFKLAKTDNTVIFEKLKDLGFKFARMSNGYDLLTFCFEKGKYNLANFFLKCNRLFVRNRLRSAKREEYWEKTSITTKIIESRKVEFIESFARSDSIMISDALRDKIFRKFGDLISAKPENEKIFIGLLNGLNYLDEEKIKQGDLDEDKIKLGSEFLFENCPKTVRIYDTKNELAIISVKEALKFKSIRDSVMDSLEVNRN